MTLSQIPCAAQPCPTADEYGSPFVLKPADVLRGRDLRLVPTCHVTNDAAKPVATTDARAMVDSPTGYPHR